MRPILAALLITALATPALAADPALVGMARIPSDTRDQLGETLGGMGSGMTLAPGSWRHTAQGYSGTLWMLPDRGWNTEGTTDYRARLQRFTFTLAPETGTSTAQDQLKLTYRSSLLFTDAQGRVTTGLDPAAVRPAAGGMPDLPVATNGRISMDDEGVVADSKGGFWVSDEYGPYVYHYDARGRMQGAIRPPDAFIPMRGGRQDFSANSPPHGTTYDKGDPDSGRQNNQGFEGLAISPDHKHLFVINQSALRQDLDPADVKGTRRNVRLLEYDIAASPRLIHEYAVQLPLYQDSGKSLVAAQSEMLAIDDHRLLLLCRDSGGGLGGKRDNSLYRNVELIDLKGATDIRGRDDSAAQSIAPKGVLDPAITPVAISDFLDMNNDAQLARLGLHNGAPQDQNDLYEKWESMALAPVDDKKAPDDYFLFIGSDNDFITQHGMMAGKPYADASGLNIDTLVLVWRVTVPK